MPFPPLRPNGRPNDRPRRGACADAPKAIRRGEQPLRAGKWNGREGILLSLFFKKAEMDSTHG